MENSKSTMFVVALLFLVLGIILGITYSTKKDIGNVRNEAAVVYTTSTKCSLGDGKTSYACPTGSVCSTTNLNTVGYCQVKQLKDVQCSFGDSKTSYACPTGTTCSTTDLSQIGYCQNQPASCTESKYCNTNFPGTYCQIDKKETVGKCVTM